MYAALDVCQLTDSLHAPKPAPTLFWVATTSCRHFVTKKSSTDALCMSALQLYLQPMKRKRTGVCTHKAYLQIYEEQTYVWDGTTADLGREQTHTEVQVMQAERASAQPRNVAVAVRKPATT